MTLYIDTTDFNKVIFAISRKSSRPSGARAGIQKKSYKIDPHESHKTLAKLDEFLHKSKIPAWPVGRLNPKSEIKEIVVNKGPGSYTGVRVGVSMAMALGLAWGIPVTVVAKEKFKIG